MKQPLDGTLGPIASADPGWRPTPGTQVTDRIQSGDFLRRRREALRPEDLGLAPRARRRTPGPRRDEVAAMANMSTAYYESLEQARGPQPSASILANIVTALRLTPDERHYLYLLAGQAPPAPAEARTTSTRDCRTHWTRSRPRHPRSSPTTSPMSWYRTL